MENRSILIFGKEGSGKSTVANQIVSNKYSLNEQGVYDQCTTKIVGITEYQAQKYEFSVVDTVGISNDESKIEEIKQFLQYNQPADFNIILFTWKLGRFTEEDKRTFDTILEAFDTSIVENSLLVITHCDGKSASARNRIIDDFRTSDNTKEISAYMTKGIITVGFPDYRDLDEDDLPLFQEKIENDRAILLKLIIESTRRIHVNYEARPPCPNILRHYFSRRLRRYCNIL